MRVSYDYPQAPWIDVPSTIMFRRQIVKNLTSPRYSGQPVRGSTVRRSNAPDMEALIIALLLRLYAYYGFICLPFP